MVLEKTLESPLDSKEITLVNPKGNKPWIFIGRTDAEVDVPVLWPPNGKSHLIGKDLDAGKDWRQKEKRMIEDEMVDGINESMDEFEQTVADGEGQGAWHAVVHGVPKSWHDLVTEQQQGETGRWNYICLQIRFWYKILCLIIKLLKYVPSLCLLFLFQKLHGWQ